MERLEERVVPAVILWDGGGGDNLWSNRLNWSTDVLPGPADDVRIAAGNDVVFSGSATVKTIDSGGDLTLIDGSLASTHGMTFRADLTIVGGSLGGSVGLVDGVLTIDAAATAPLSIAMAGESTLQGVVHAGQTIQIAGGLLGRHADVSVVDVSNAGTIELRSTRYTYRSNLSGSLTVEPGGVLAAHTDYNGERKFVGSLVNRGTIDARAALTITGESYEAAGGLLLGYAYLLDAELRTTAASREPSTIRVAGEGVRLTTDLESGYTVWVGGGWYNQHANLQVAEGAANRGRIELRSTKYNYRSNLSGSFINDVGGTIAAHTDYNGERRFVGSLVNRGTLDARATLTVVDSALRSESGAISGSVLQTGGTFVHAGGDVSGLILVDVAATLGGAGSVWVGAGGGTTLTGGLRPGQTAQIGGGWSNRHADVSTLGTFVNAGTIELRSTRYNYRSNLSGSLTVEPGGVLAAHTNYNGERRFVGSLVNRGTIDARAALTITGGTYEAAGGVLSGDAYLLDAELRTTAASREPSTIRVAGEGVRLTTDLESGYTVWVGGGWFNQNGNLFVAPGRIVRGEILLDSRRSSYASRLSVDDGGTLLVAAGGRIDVGGSFGAARSINAELRNAGVVSLATTTTIGATDAKHENYGLVALLGGSVNVTGASFTNLAGGYIGGSGSITGPGGTIVNRGLIDLNAAPAVIDAELKPRTLRVTFNTAMNAATLADPRNYQLVGSGGDGIFGNGNDVDRSDLLVLPTVAENGRSISFSLPSALSEDVYRLTLDGVAIRSSGGSALYPGDLVLTLGMNHVISGTIAFRLQTTSDTGVSNSDGLTAIAEPTIDVTVSDAGRIEIDVDQDGATDAALDVSAGGTYAVTLPALADGERRITATFTPIDGRPVSTSAVYRIDTASPSPLPGAAEEEAPITSRRLVFSEAIDASTVSGRIGLYDVEGVLVASPTVSGSGTTFELTFPELTEPGLYEIRVAAGVRDLAGNAAPAFVDPFRLGNDVTRPTVAVDGFPIAGKTSPSLVKLTFSEPVRVSTVNAATVTLTAPDGSAIPLTIEPGAEPNTFAIAIPPVVGDGLYTLRIGAGILDRSGNSLVPVERSFRLDQTAPAIVSISPTGTAWTPVSHVDVRFSETVAWTNLASATVTGPTGSIAVTGVSRPSSDVIRIAFAPTTVSGKFTVSIPAGAIADAVGNAAPAVSSTFAQELARDLSISFAAGSVTEGETIVGTVSRSGAIDAALTVHLSSANGAKLTVPASVVIPAGASFATFTASTVDDPSIDKAASVTISATAAGYTAASRAVQVLDDDIPTLTLTLDSTTAMEGGADVTATVTRDKVTNLPLTVKLRSSDASSAAVPATVIIPAGSASVTFLVTPLADGVVDGSKEIILTANGAYTDCGCTIVEGAGTASLTVLDADASGLRLTIGDVELGEGRNTIGEITRGDVSGALTVALSAAPAGAVSIPAFVTFAAGQSTATFTIGAIDDGVAAGSRVATITASAEGLAPSSATITIIDASAPDLALGIGSLIVPPGGTAGQRVTIGYTVTNVGRSEAVGPWTDAVYISTDQTLSPDDVLAGEYRFHGAVPTGLYYQRDVTISLPSQPGSYWVIVVTDSRHELAEASEANNQRVSTSPIETSASFTATVRAAKNIHGTGEKVLLTGSATRTAGGPAAFEIVNIEIVTGAFVRSIAAITDEAGNFRATFNPLPGEAGAYTAAAGHPGVTSLPAQTAFTIVGVSASAVPALSAVEGDSVSFTIDLANRVDVPLTGLTAQAVGLPAGVTATIAGPSSLAGFETATLSVDLATSEVASTTRTSFQIRVTTAEGAIVDVPVDLTVVNRAAELVVTPAKISAGMTVGRQTIVRFTVQNTGSLPTGPLEVRLPALDWLSAATPVLASIAPGETSSVTLVLNAPANMPLTMYNGWLVLAGSDVAERVDFAFRAVTEAKGDLRITATDEYTYHAAGSPRLAGATVEIADPFTGAVVRAGVTDASGSLFVPGLPAGYYNLTVRAEKHLTYSGTFLVNIGAETAVEAFLPGEYVSYNWTVAPTEIEDNYQIHLESVFETNVPAPVLIVDGNIDLSTAATDGSVTMYPLTIRNEGLIEARNVKLTLPSHPSWDIVPLITDIGTLGPKSSITIPVRVTRVFSRITGIDFDVTLPDPPIEAASLSQPTEDGGRRLASISEESEGSGPIELGAAKIAELLFYESLEGEAYKGIGLAALAVLPTAFAHISKFIGPGGHNGNGDNRPTTAAPSHYGPGSYVSSIAKRSDSFLALSEKMKPEILNAITAYLCEGTPLPDRIATGGLKFGRTALSPTMNLDLALAFGGMDDDRGYLEIRRDTLVTTETKDDCGNARTEFSVVIVFHQFDTYNFEPNTHQMYELQKYGWGSTFETSIDIAIRLSGYVVCDKEAEPCGPCNLAGSVAGDFLCGDVLVPTFGIIPIQNAATGCSPTPPSTVWESSRLIGASGSFGTPGASEVWFVSPTDCLPIFRSTRDIQAMAYDNGVCAEVRIRTDQSLVQTRSAFEATLELTNRQQTSPLTDVDIDLAIYDEAGNDVTDRFQIRPPSLSGLNAVDGSGMVGVDSTGRASWVIVPSDEAAPTGSTSYFVGGTLRYNDGGRAIEITLANAPITVLPNPQLVVHYFHQRDVFGDDPFTDVIEPSQPYSLAVLVQNVGAGDATNLSITSAQPKIVENEKGLLVDFQIIATEVHGQNLSPSLTANFGTVEAGDTAIARWLLTSSLQGRFIDYDATFEHLDAFGDERLSIIKSVAIHELLHIVDAGENGDTRPDFLTNENHQEDTLPDTVWFSDGTNAPVSVSANSATAGARTLDSPEMTLTADASTGYSYTSVVIPTDPGFRLLRAIRSDGKTIELGANLWVTDRTFAERAQRPVYETRVHLFDLDSTGEYTLIFEAVDLPAVAVQKVGQPTPINRTTAVDSIDVTFSRAIDATTLDAADFTLLRDGQVAPIVGTLSVTSLGGSTYRVTGFAASTTPDGAYTLRVSGAGVADAGGRAGAEGTVETSWMMGEQAPYVTIVRGVAPGATISGAVDDLTVEFSFPVDPGSFTTADLTLTRDGGRNLLDGAEGVSIIQLSDVQFRIDGLGGITAADGAYALTVQAVGVSTPRGTSGIGAYALAWTNDATAPAAPTSLQFTPDTGASDVDGRTNATNVVISGLVSEAGEVRLFDVMTGRDLGAAVVSNGAFSAMVDLVTPGAHQVRARVTDAAGNTADAFLSIFVDQTAPTVESVLGLPATPMAASVDEATIRFSKAIDPATISLASFSLSRNGGADLLGEDVLIEIVDDRTLVLRGLASRTAEPGVYALTIRAGGLADDVGNRVTADHTAAWGNAAATPVDVSAPTSRVEALPAESLASFVVRWSGTDGDGSGIASFDVHVSTDGGAFAPWLSGTTLTASVFTGQVGATYGFHVIARDAAGNIEGAKSTAEATTTTVEPSPIEPGGIRGVLYEDMNANGVFDEGEPGLAGWVVFLDADGDGVLSESEAWTTTAADGTYEFTDLAPGTYVVAAVRPDPWISYSIQTVTSSDAPPSSSGPLAADSDAMSLIRLNDLRNDPRFAGVDGSGSTIVFLDTGLAWAGGAFGPDADGDGVPDAVVFQYDFVENDFVAQDASGHGTAITALAHVIAPGANLIVLRVLDAAGRGDFAAVEKALRWVVDNVDRYNIVAVNMSFGDGDGWPSPISRYGLGDEFAALAAEGVLVVAAAGNNYALAGADGLAYPAADPNVLPVGAVYASDQGATSWTGGARDDSSGPDRIAAFSQRDLAGSTLFAPGAYVATVGVAGERIVLSGTSVAAAQVTAAVALAQQIAQRELGRSLTAAEVRLLLVGSGTTIRDGDDERDNVVNTGAEYRRLDLFALAESVESHLPTPGADFTSIAPQGPAFAFASASSGRLAVVSEGRVTQGVDLGLYRPASLGVRVYYDHDADGVADEGEPGVEGVLVFLDDDGDGVRGDDELFAFTDSTGMAIFRDLRPGQYRPVVEIPSENEPTTSAEPVVVLVSGQAGEAPAVGLALRDNVAPAIVSVVIQNGDAQRSHVRETRWTFSEDVDLQRLIDDGTIIQAFRLVEYGLDGNSDGRSASISASQFHYDSASRTLTWVLDDPEASLPDGYYEWEVDGGRIADAAGNPLNEGRTTITSFHRLFGDADGDMVIGDDDQKAVNEAIGTRAGQEGWDPTLDLDGDGIITARDRLALARAKGSRVTTRDNS